MKKFKLGDFIFMIFLSIIMLLLLGILVYIVNIVWELIGTWFAIINGIAFTIMYISAMLSFVRYYKNFY